MLWFTQGENGVLIQFSDKKTFEGDILVGADGPNSAVRQCLFESLKKAKKLSRDDTKAFEREKEGLVGQGLSSNSRRRQSVTLIGQTNQLENSLFSSPGNERDNEVGNEEVSLFYNTRLNNHSFSWNVVTCGDDTINWTVTQYYAASPSSSIPSPQTIDWSSDGVAIESMCKHIYNLPIPSLQGDNVASFISKMPASNGDTNESIALTVGDLIDKTPREQMTKVVSEDQLYETWYYCRTVLIGDACHKLRPVANQGAYLALMDAYALFLNVSKLETTQLKHLTPALKAYKSTRLPASQRAWMLSKALSRINSSNESYTGTMARKILQKLPVWARRKVFEQFMFVDNVNQRKSRTTTEESQCTLSGCDTSSLGEISDFNSSLISLQPDVKEIEALVAAMNCEIEKGSTEELPSTMSSKASEKPNTTTI
ncbi:hypothetical protein FBU30_005086 [Linnemannia zychae]|nr:hypothetical protein FBU30_005086 [Linnemannia zychae]